MTVVGVVDVDVLCSCSALHFGTLCLVYTQIFCCSTGLHRADTKKETLLADC